MKFSKHPAASRGEANHGWLQSQHSFSFANYYNPERMGFGALRVINDDIVAPTRGFGTHPHENMEIISIPLRGSLKHKDTMGNEHVITSEDVQVMSAGSGLLHSEYNHSATDEVNFLQIWVFPKEKNTQPRYSQKSFDSRDRRNRLQLLVSPEGKENSVEINQDAYFSRLVLEDGAKVEYPKHRRESGVYLFVIDGEVKVSGETLSKRDGLGIEESGELELSSPKGSDVLIIEVPMSFT